METVLIAGGTGLVGKHLISLLLANNYRVRVLSRQKQSHPAIEYFLWDLDKGYIEENALKDVQHLINLSGANIGSERWSEKRKQEIVSSRTESAQLLFDTVKKEKIALRTYITSSAVGYYGGVTSEKIFTESDPPASDFLGSVCQKWEEKSLLFVKDNIRTIQVRIGVVLAKEDGALPKMLKPIQMGFGAVLGSGRQYIPWIHIDDIVKVFLWVLQNPSVAGAYNAVAPNPVNNKQLTRSIAKTINKKILLPAVPGFMLKLILGEMAELALEGSRVSNKKLLDTGITFQYSDVDEALNNLLK